MVTYKYNKKTNNIKVLNPHELTTKAEILAYLNTLPLELVNRSKKSCLNEWIAHNRLYKLGLFKTHTVDCDLSKDEKLRRRICYWFLSRFCK
jgi:hypothetical protein